MGAYRQPTQYIFPADDSQHQSTKGPIQRRDENNAAGLQVRRAIGNQFPGVINMLNDFKVEHYVEQFLRCHSAMSGAMPVVNLDTRSVCMASCNFNIA